MHATYLRPLPSIPAVLALVICTCLMPSIGDSLCLGLISPHAMVPCLCVPSMLHLIYMSSGTYVFRPHLSCLHLSPTTHCVPHVSSHVPVMPCQPSAMRHGTHIHMDTPMHSDQPPSLRHMQITHMHHTPYCSYTSPALP